MALTVTKSAPLQLCNWELSGPDLGEVRKTNTKRLCHQHITKSRKNKQTHTLLTLVTTHTHEQATDVSDIHSYKWSTVVLQTCRNPHEGSWRTPTRDNRNEVMMLTSLLPILWTVFTMCSMAIHSYRHTPVRTSISVVYNWDQTQPVLLLFTYKKRCTR